MDPAGRGRRFVDDSPLEQAGFELLVPRDTCSDAGRFGRSVLAPDQMDPMSDGRTDDSARNVVATARFVKAQWSVSSAAIASAASASGGSSGSNAPTLSCCSEDPAGCAATRLGSYGGKWSAADGIRPGPVTEERGAFVPQKP